MSITAYLTLGLTPPEADQMADEALDARLRARYLQLVREAGPSTHSERFARISAAYQQVATARLRAEYALFGRGALGTTDDGLSALMLAADERRPGVGLAGLAAACEVSCD